MGWIKAVVKGAGNGGTKIHMAQTTRTCFLPSLLPVILCKLQNELGGGGNKLCIALKESLMLKNLMLLLAALSFVTLMQSGAYSPD